MTDSQRGDSKQCNMTSVILPKSASPALLHVKTQNTCPLRLPTLLKRKAPFYCKPVSLSLQPCENVGFSHLLSSPSSLSLPRVYVMLSSRSAFCLWLFPPWISIPNMVILLGVSHFPPQPIPFLLCVSSSAHSTVGGTKRRGIAGEIVEIEDRGGAREMKRLTEWRQLHSICCFF